MAAFTLYHNPQCSKSREALAFLQTRGVDFSVVEYLKNPLSASELKTLMSQLGSQKSLLVRIKEEGFTYDPFDLNSEDVVAEKLAANPRLMERPILQGNGKAAIGRPLENFENLLRY